MAPQNGAVPAALLVEVDGLLLARDTAAAFARANAASGGKLGIAKPAGAYRSLAVQADMIHNPGHYGLNPNSSVPLAQPGHSSHGTGNRVDVVGDGFAWFLAHAAEFGFSREFGAADPNHFEFAAETWPGPAPVVVPPVPAVKGWQVGETDFKGSYGENTLNGAHWYVIEPTTSASKTIWAICQQFGITTAQAAEWSAKVRDSKWGGQLLQSGSSWWDGSDRYFAGVCIALNDVAAALDAYEAQQLASQQAAAQAAQQAVEAAQAEQAQQDADAAKVSQLVARTDSEATARIEAVKAAPAVEPTPAPEPPVSAKEAAADAAKMETANAPVESATEDANTGAPLAGLLAGRTVTRKRAYYAYAGAALLISFAPDVVIAGILTGHQADVVTASATLASSILLKIGVAFGFVAASNTGK